MNTSRGTIENLDELIEIAEKSSETLKNINQRFSRRVFTFCIAIMLGLVSLIGLLAFFRKNGIYEMFYTKDVFEGFVSTAGVLSIVFSNLILVKTLLDIRTLQKERMLEKSVLERLLEMIDELKGSVFRKDEISPVRKALIEIKLSRISFTSPPILFGMFPKASKTQSRNPISNRYLK